MAAKVPMGTSSLFIPNDWYSSGSMNLYERLSKSWWLADGGENLGGCGWFLLLFIMMPGSSALRRSINWFDPGH